MQDEEEANWNARPKLFLRKTKSLKLTEIKKDAVGQKSKGQSKLVFPQKSQKLSLILLLEIFCSFINSSFKSRRKNSKVSKITFWVRFVESAVGACNFIKKRLQHKYLPVNIAKFFKYSFFIEQLWCLFLNLYHSFSLFQCFLLFCSIFSIMLERIKINETLVRREII